MSRGAPGEQASGQDTGAHYEKGYHHISGYDGSRKKDAYKNWKKEIEVYQLAYDVPQKQLAPRIWLRLTGEAKQCVESIDVKELAKEDGVDKLMKVLDKQFMKEEYDEIDKAVSVFWSCRRAAGQNMESYILTMRLAKNQMEKEDPDTTIGDQAYAVRLLKRAGLSAQDKQAVFECHGSQIRHGPDRTSIEKVVPRCVGDRQAKLEKRTRHRSEKMGKVFRKRERIQERELSIHIRSRGSRRF